MIKTTKIFQKRKKWLDCAKKHANRQIGKKHNVELKKTDKTMDMKDLSMMKKKTEKTKKKKMQVMIRNQNVKKMLWA